MYVFRKCRVLKRTYEDGDQTYMDSKQQVINGERPELNRMGKTASIRKQDKHLYYFLKSSVII